MIITTEQKNTIKRLNGYRSKHSIVQDEMSKLKDQLKSINKTISIETDRNVLKLRNEVKCIIEELIINSEKRLALYKNLSIKTAREAVTIGAIKIKRFPEKTRREVSQEFKNVILKVADWQKSVVLVNTIFTDQFNLAIYKATGFIIDKQNGYLLTNAHNILRVIKNSRDFMIFRNFASVIRIETNQFNGFLDCKVIAYNEAKDLALLRFDPQILDKDDLENLHDVIFDTRSAIVDESIVCLGNHLNSWEKDNSFSASIGRIFQFSGYDEVSYNAKTYPGASGSPIFILQEGTICGMHKRGSYNLYEQKEIFKENKLGRGGQNTIGIGVPSNIIIDFIAAFNSRAMQKVNFKTA